MSLDCCDIGLTLNVKSPSRHFDSIQNVALVKGLFFD